MEQQDFNKLANKLGDFNVFYRRRDGSKAHTVATTDLTTKYITSKGKAPKETPGTVVMWSWTADRYLKLPISCIGWVTPLDCAKQNARRFN